MPAALPPTTEPANTGFFRYWRFWWPLALVGLAMPFARVVQNGTLARFPDGTTELALFALAQGSFFIPRSAMVFMPQLATVLARTRAQHRRCRRFAVGIGIALGVPVLLLAGPGQALLEPLFNITPDQRVHVARYLLWLSPLLLLDGITSYTNGLLVRHERTGSVSLGTLSNLLVIGISAWLGLSLGWSPITTVVGGQCAAAVVNTGVVLTAWSRTTQRFDEQGKDIPVAALLRFYCPLAITSMMFACSRPVIYAIVGGTPDGLQTIAVLRVAFDLGMLFQLPVNQFRHLLVTFASSDLAGVRSFMRHIVIGVTVIMAVVLVGPIADVLLGPVLGADSGLHADIREAWLMLILVPAVVTWRNYHHGLAMVGRSTSIMAAAGLLRVGLIAAACLIARSLGLLDHLTGAIAMVAGFAIEAVVVAAGSRYRRQRAAVL